MHGLIISLYNFRITIHAGISGRNYLYVNVWENDIAVIKIKNGTNLHCKKRQIWPGCLPNEVSSNMKLNNDLLPSFAMS